MGLWSAFFAGHDRFMPDASKGADWNRGAYIAEALAHCGECHTPRNLAFGLNNRDKFAGALTAGWRAYNISSDPVSGVGAWSDDQLSAYLMSGHVEGHGAAAGPMAEAVDESFSQMAPEDIHALVAYLRSVPATRSSDLPATLDRPAPDGHKAGFVGSDPRGKMVFEQACASCHSWSGVSPIIPFATLTGARSVNDPTATNVAQIVISGTRRTTPTGVVTMPAFGKTYTDAEIAAVANYVTGRFGSQASKIGPDRVEALRKQTAQ
jgi:mono/diheme cytochrome c family protein